MALASTHVDRSERLETGKRIFTDTIHMKPIASYKNGSLRRDPGVLSATGAADWPLGVDGICDVRIAPRIAGKSPLLHMGHGSHFVRFSLVGANNVSGVAKGNATTFTNAWNNADLRYTYGGHRVQEDIPLRAKHPRSFGFILREHTGFDPVTMTVGDIRILDPVLEPPSGSDKLAVPLRWIVTQQGGYWVLTVTLPAGDWAGWTIDPTLSLQPAAADGMDTLILDSAVNNNYGVFSTVNVGTGATANKTRGLLQFTLTGLPAGVTLTSASLTLYCESEGATADEVVGAHRALTQWYEGAESGGVPDPGQDGSTWNLRNANGAVAWAGGAGGAAGSDWTALATDSEAITAPTASYTWGVLADVAAWYAGTATNYGWWLINTDEANANTTKRFTSSDGATAGQRPKLTIDYTLPGGGGIFGSSIFHSAIHGGTLTR